MSEPKMVPLTERHAKAADASVANILAVAGIVRLTQPVPAEGLDTLAPAAQRPAAGARGERGES